jgi:isochorismate synthase
LKIFDKITAFHENHLPFVVYRKPNTKTIAGFFMKDTVVSHTTTFSESGFVFAPFNIAEKAILFPLEKAEVVVEELFLGDMYADEKKFITDAASKEYHIKLVEKTIHEISTTALKKVVISRKEKIELAAFDILEVFQKLLQNYKNAFVYVWFHPEVGLWLGATPETLVDIENSVFKTMSLAGTQLYLGDSESGSAQTELESTQVKNIVWKTKELEEQQLVTDFIKDQLKDITTNLKIDKTKTVKAGNLLHLKTSVTGRLAEKSNLKELIRALHPTPAVCGLPRNSAKEFILANENYNRAFYTGFLGEMHLDDDNLKGKKSSLFVNLRCMEIHNKNAFVYVGGGITKDSDAKKEWEETFSKSKTMKKVL